MRKIKFKLLTTLYHRLVYDSPPPAKKKKKTPSPHINKMIKKIGKCLRKCCMIVGKSD